MRSRTNRRDANGSHHRPNATPQHDRNQLRAGAVCSILNPQSSILNPESSPGIYSVPVPTNPAELTNNLQGGLR
jgi:hypothetical protein